MLKGLLHKLQQTVMGGAIIIGSASVVSRLLGLFRDRLLADQFGAGELLDSYFTAFKIPDFFFNILVLGVMSASFVPVFIEYLGKNGKQDAMRIANSLLNLLIIVLFGLGVILFFCTPSLISIIAYGDTIEQQETIIQFTRIMLLSLFFFGISNLLSGVLHASKRFLIYSLAPIMYNVGIIIGILVLVPWLGSIGLPIGVVLGAFLHFVVQIPAVYQAGFSYKAICQLRHKGVIQILKLMPPRAFALGLTQLNIVIIFAIASTLDAGSRSVWQFADNIQHFPINIFGVSLALAAFPVFSEAFAENNLERFKNCFSENFRRILFFIIPVSIAVLLMRAQLIRLVYGAGEFDWNDTVMTAQTLGVFALSMFAQALIPLLARSFFARQDTKTPVIISATSMVLNIVLAVVLVRGMNVIGLALAFSVSAIFQMLALLTVLRIRHGDLDDDRIITSTWKIIVSSLGMGIIIQGMKYAMAPIVDMQTFIGVFLQTFCATIAGVIAYLFIAFNFQFAEAQAIVRRIKTMWNLVRRLRKVPSGTSNSKQK